MYQKINIMSTRAHNMSKHYWYRLFNAHVNNFYLESLRPPRVKQKSKYGSILKIFYWKSVTENHLWLSIDFFQWKLPFGNTLRNLFRSSSTTGHQFSEQQTHHIKNSMDLQQTDRVRSSINLAFDCRLLFSNTTVHSDWSTNTIIQK